MPLSVLPTEPRYWRATFAVLVAGLAVAGVVDDQHPVVVGRCGRVAQQQLHAALVELLVVPGRLRQEELQALHGPLLRADHRFGAGQTGQGLVAVSWQQDGSAPCLPSSSPS